MSAIHSSPGSSGTGGTVLVTGGTGTIGRVVVERLVAAGREVRVLSRSAPSQPLPGAEHVAGDLATGAGLDEAVAGVTTVVHCAGGASGDDEKARTLVAALERAGVRPHIVHISVVGVDEMPIESGVDRALFGYFAAKLGAERAIIESGLPWTMLRSTQTHELTLETFRLLAKLPVAPVFAGVRLQPIAAAEVGARLAELALGEPRGLVADVGGPEVHGMGELARDALRHLGKRRAVLPIRLPGGAARAYREGANLAPEHATGAMTWDAFLQQRAEVAA